MSVFDIKNLTVRVAHKLNSVIFKRHQSAEYWISKIDLPSPMIVQIGSNDGRHGDPLFNVLMNKPTWRALFVEPVPYLFERLKRNYSCNSNYIFSNAAINDGEEMTFYYVDQKARDCIEDLPIWFDQLGSFRRDHIPNSPLGEVLSPFIIEKKILGISLNDLFVENDINDIALLHIDTEGYDWRILSQLDLSRFSPLIIIFEYKCLSCKEKTEAINSLEDSYHLFYLGDDDIIAIRRRDNKAVCSKLWMMRNKRASNNQ